MAWCEALQGAGVRGGTQLEPRQKGVAGRARRSLQQLISPNTHRPNAQDDEFSTVAQAWISVDVARFAAATPAERAAARAAAAAALTAAAREAVAAPAGYSYSGRGLPTTTTTAASPSSMPPSPEPQAARLTKRSPGWRRDGTAAPTTAARSAAASATAGVRGVLRQRQRQACNLRANGCSLVHSRLQPRALQAAAQMYYRLHASCRRE